MIREKYAILDADFISKTHLIRKDDQNKMIDLIMKLHGYRFFCHEQIKNELKRDSLGNSYEWLETMISNGFVRCVSDEEILSELCLIYSNSAAAMYVSLLKNGCEAYQKGYFEENFTHLQSLNSLSISRDELLRNLEEDCGEISVGKNLGELKSYILLQMLNTKHGEQIYVFCSDDKNARVGVVSLGSARCISVLSAFMILNREGILRREDAEPYIRTYLNECQKNNQMTFRIHTASKQMQMCKIPCEQVIEEMYAGNFELLKNGNLRYKM